MTFLTIFTAPKPFLDTHIDTIQRNAIQSWQHLGDDVEVLLIGEEDGLAEVAQEYSLKHLPDVARNEWGTPLVSSIFSLAREASKAPVLAYVNADMLLMPEFVNVARITVEQSKEFLIVGRRWDLDLNEQLSFDDNWVSELRNSVQTNGILHAPAGSDYFIFPRTIFADIPDFAIGRAGWDNWMIYQGLQKKWSVVDATESLVVIHQNHDYAHLPGGQMHYDLEETQINAELGGGMQNMYMVLDASHEFIGESIRPVGFHPARFVRKLERIVYSPDQRGLRWLLIRQLRRLRRKLVSN
ncbi:MAG: glycosyltransferase family 2 protein [Anaerolineales bacterium]|nr:glycosyltransferase family 2 protein [Chloroflexota bacterium]MBL6979866.1 glycosyltransferase family 2 protein [Anaerolineales bacterium]